MERLAALILAAGVSSRMEQFKPMLPIGEDTVIRRTVKTMLQAGADPVVVVTGYKSDLLKRHLGDLPIVLLHNDRYASTQMFDSLLIGLEYLLRRCDRLLLSPGDVPTVQLETVQQLLLRRAQVVRPAYREKTGHPILLSGDVLESIREYHGEGGLSGAIEALGLEVQDVPVDDEGVILDADTPEEYTKLLYHNLKVGGGSEQLRLSLRLHLCTMDAVFDPGTAQFLEMVEITGSMQMACRAVHISYSKGWKMIRKLEAALGFPLLKRMVGGAEGGGSQLSAQGSEMLHNYQKMEEEVLAQAEESFARCFRDYLHLHPTMEKTAEPSSKEE